MYRPHYTDTEGVRLFAAPALVPAFLSPIGQVLAFFPCPSTMTITSHKSAGLADGDMSSHAPLTNPNQQPVSGLRKIQMIPESCLGNCRSVTASQLVEGYIVTLSPL